MYKTILLILGVALVAGAAILLLLAPEPVENDLPTPTTEETNFVTILPSETEPLPADDTVVAIDEPIEDEPVVLEETETEAETAPAEAVAESQPDESGFAVDGTIFAGEYPHRADIAGVEVYWMNNAEYLRVGLVSPGTGYVSIGFDPENGMKGANYIIAYMNEGEIYVRDDFGTEPTSHMADDDRGGTNDILSAAGAEWPDQTIIEFVIPLDSGDASDKPLSPGRTYPILVAYHSVSDGFTARHSRRGSGEITLDWVQ